MIAYIPYAPVAPQLPHNGGGNIVFPCVLLAVGIACFTKINRLWECFFRNV